VSGIGDIVQVVLGPDFNTISAPPPSGSSVQVLLSEDSHHRPSPLPSDLNVTNAADITCE
jgi:hypothetical protein